MEHVEGAVGGGDGLLSRPQALDVDELEGEMVDAGVEGPGEQAEQDQHAAPQRPSRLRHPHPPDQGDDRGPQQDVPGDEGAVRQADPARARGEGGELRGEEAVRVHAEEDADEHQKRPEEKPCRLDPATGECGCHAVDPSGGALVAHWRKGEPSG
ncbi:hypothetical protein ACFSTC_53030 [Nonomuraea ferruginea]